ncbi:hypothetical protein [Lysinibacillus sp. FSL W7-1291]|uniref:hypothetical protein n=1 Tax=Lysinibacillus sp. FSL W7-1291 TaxID=2954544 RepID=UPI003159CD87
MRKTLIYFLGFVLFLSFFGSEVKAMERVDSKTLEIIDGTTLNSRELEDLLNSNKEFTVELSDQQVAEQYAKIKSVTIQEAYSKLAEYNKLDTFSPKAESCSWFGTNTEIPIFGKTYRPLLQVYVQICSSGGTPKYINTNQAPLLQEFVANPISFSGTIKVELHNGHFLFLINGNFYNSTSTTHTGTIGVGNIFTASYSVASSSSFYASLTTGLTKRDVLGY